MSHIRLCDKLESKTQFYRMGIYIHPNLYFKSEDHFVGVAWQGILPEVTVKSTKHGRVSLTMLEGEG